MRCAFSLFQKSFLYSAIVTGVLVMGYFVPFTRPRVGDFSNELRPEALEYLALAWFMPPGLVVECLSQIGFDSSKYAGLLGGRWLGFLFVTLFWTVIFYVIARVVRFGMLNIVTLKKR